MGDSITDGETEAIDEDETDGKEAKTEEDITNRPSVIKSTKDEDELEDDVDGETGSVEDVHEDPEGEWM